MQSQSQSTLFISFLLCLATTSTTILSKTINLVSNSNEIIKVVRSKSQRRNYIIMAEALTPQYQPFAVGVSIRTSSSALSSSIALPSSSTTIGQQHHHHRRPQQGKGNDAAVAKKTKTNTAVGMTTNTSVDPFLLHLAHHHHQHHPCQSHSLSKSATSSSSSSTTRAATATAVAATHHVAYQRPRYGRSSSRRLRLQRRLHILKTTLQELEVHRRRNQN